MIKGGDESNEELFVAGRGVLKVGAGAELFAGRAVFKLGTGNKELFVGRGVPKHVQFKFLCMH